MKESQNVIISCQGYSIPEILLPLNKISNSHALIPLEAGLKIGSFLNLEIIFPNGNIYKLKSVIERNERVSPTEMVKCRLIFEDDGTVARFGYDVGNYEVNEEDKLQARHYPVMMEISKALGAEIHFDDLLKVIISKITQIMNAERSSLFIYDEDKKQLYSKVTEGLEKKIISFPISLGIVGHVVKTREALIIHDAYNDPRFNPEFDRINKYHTKTIICVPLINNTGKLIGAIEVLNKKDDGVFNEADESLLVLLSTHVTIAMERAQLTEEYIKNQKMEKELKLAGDLQMSLLPKQPFPLIESILFRIKASIVPAGSVGGDFYDFFYFDEHQVFFVIGDVSGKGMPAALFMAMTKTLIKATVHEELSLDDALFRVNNELCQENESCMFVTIFVGILDLERGEIQYSNAGHTKPLLISNEGSVKELSMKEGIALGIIENYRYEARRIKIDKGATLFLYTDGLYDAVDEEGNEYSIENIIGSIENMKEYSANNITEESICEVMRFMDSAPQSDDITIMAIQYTG